MSIPYYRRPPSAWRLLLPLLAMTAIDRLSAQTIPDTLRLATLHRLAESSDPRARQSTLLRQQAEARLETIRRERLPSVSTTASAQYLSDVARVGPLPGIGPVGPPNDQYDAYATVRAPLLDPTRRARRAVEDERLAESEATLRSSLYAQRGQVNDAFFAVLHRRVQQQVITAGLDDLRTRRRIAQLRVDAGAALQSEVLLLDAELVRRQQSLQEAAAEEAIALKLLGSLTGRQIDAGTVLLAPEGIPTGPADARARPEYAQFERSRSVLRARDAAVAALDRPRFSMVTRTGYGRPGLNGLGRTFDSYLSAGVQVEWTPWNWGATRRERETLRIGAETLRTNEAAFTRSLDRATSADAARLETLQQLASSDDTVVALRERILAEARLRYDEGELTTVDYVARSNEQLIARLERETRRLRIAETRARYLTTLGQEIP